ncbi:hypothetical protein [Corynebacterium sp. H130]|uniref:hypothetical protein n=1 Tax=Corynebacterium sp. H130 TaxID=3133444 RepID=UPI00309AC0A9
MVLIPTACVLWLAFEIYYTKRRSPLMAVVNALVTLGSVWFICMGPVEWTTKAPIGLWWVIALLCGALAAVSTWPRHN